MKSCPAQMAGCLMEALLKEAAQDNEVVDLGSAWDFDLPSPCMIRTPCLFRTPTTTVASPRAASAPLQLALADLLDKSTDSWADPNTQLREVEEAPRLGEAPWPQPCTKPSLIGTSDWNTHMGTMHRQHQASAIAMLDPRQPLQSMQAMGRPLPCLATRPSSTALPVRLRSFDQALSCQSPQVAAPVASLFAAAERVLAAEAMSSPPAPSKQPHEALTSLGSFQHVAGKCSPCAFFYSRGCDNGFACNFCHLCDASERRKRRRRQQREEQRPRAART